MEAGKEEKRGVETFQHLPYSPDVSPYDFHIFWRPEEKTIVDVGFIRTRKCKSGLGCGSISDLPLSTRLELIVSSPSGINVLTLLAFTFE